MNWHLDSVSKRLLFLAMPLAAIIFSVSLTSYFSSPYRTILKENRYYGWTTGNQSLDSNTRYPAGKTDNLFTVEPSCAAPLAAAEVRRQQAEFDAHRAAKPAYPTVIDNTYRSRIEALASQDIKLIAALISAQRAAEKIGSGSAREGELREEILHPTPALNLLPMFPQASNAAPVRLSDEEKFDGALRWRLHISGFLKPVADEIYRTCLRKTQVVYSLVSTSWSSDIGNWWRDSALYSRSATILLLIGFFGSFGQGITLAAWKLTGGRIISWVRD